MPLIIRTVIVAALQALFGGGGTDVRQQIDDYLAGYLQLVTNILTAFGYNIEQEHGAVRYSERYATVIADDLVKTQAATLSMLNRLTFTIVPNSLGQVIHNIFQGWIVPIRRRLDNFATRIGILEGFRRSTDSWRYNTVDPTLADWRTFKRDFFRGDQPAINVLNYWLRHPVRMADSLAPYFARPLVSFLAYKGHRQDRDLLAQAMLTAWREQPERTLAEIEAWLVQPIS
jgi:hypothetical protein